MSVVSLETSASQEAPDCVRIICRILLPGPAMQAADVASKMIDPALPAKLALEKRCANAQLSVAFARGHESVFRGSFPPDGGSWRRLRPWR